MARTGATKQQLDAALAALCVRQALQPEPNEASRLNFAAREGDAQRVLAAHARRSSLRWPRRLALAGFLAVIVLQLPRWCAAAGLADCKDPPGYHTFGIGVLARGPSLVVEAALTVVLSCDLWLHYVILGPYFSTWRWRVAHAAALALLALDIVMAAVLLPWSPASWRLAPYLQVFLFACYDVKIQVEFRNLVRSTAEFMKVVLPLAAIVLFFAWFGTMLFATEFFFSEEADFFGSYGKSLWSMSDLVTTNNFPDIMFPAVTDNRWAALFFFSFLVLSIWLLLPAIMAVVYSGFLRQREEAMEAVKAHREALLNEAFDLLDTHGRGQLDRAQMDQLLQYLGSHGRCVLNDDDKRAIIFAILDNSGDGLVDRRHRFELCVDLLLIASGILNIISSYPILAGEGSHVDETGVVRELNTLLTLFFLMEMALKGFLIGWINFLRSWKNCFDSFVTLLSLFAIIVILFPNGCSNYGILRLAVMLRMLRVVRLLGDLPMFSTVFRSFDAIIPGALRVLPMLFITMLLFGTLGQDLFGGKLRQHDPALDGTAWQAGRYWALNFNDAASSLLMLLSFLVINNCDASVEAIATVSAGPSALFFVAWFIVGVCALLNVLSSVIIGAFDEHWGKVHTGEAVHPRPSVQFDAAVVTGTRTGVDGAWRVNWEYQRDMSAGEAEGHSIANFVAPAPAS